MLIIGRSKSGSAESAVYRALERAGHTATIVDDRRVAQRIGTFSAGAWLRARVAAFRPDRIYVGKGLSVDSTVLREVCKRERCGSVMWYHDLRIPPSDRMIERARCVDSFFLTAGGQRDEWKAAGVSGARFLPGAADPYEDHPVAAHDDFVSDVAFIGSGPDPHRADVLTELSRHFNVRVWGTGWEAFPPGVDWSGDEALGGDFARVCASAKIVIGIERSFHMAAPVRCYASNRVWRVLSCGGFYLGQATPGKGELLVNGRHCLWYNNMDHACSIIERYLDNPAARDRIRSTGRAFVLEHHTFDKRLENLFMGAPFQNPLTRTAGAVL